RECTLLKLNEAFRRLQLPIQGAWPKIDEVNTLRELYRDSRWREALEHTSSCFAMPQRRALSYEHWERKTPNLFAFFYRNPNTASKVKYVQDGTCIKCRIDLMARLLEHPDVIENVPPSEIEYFVNHTINWIKTRGHREQYQDFLTPTFYNALKDVCRVHLSRLSSFDTLVRKVDRLSRNE
ncbi:MAG: hypothetical protein JWQ35_2697, partial [Bacteriovoracaceae bacterium]|nr:hypothetical protein [Bacteriovoracaceae bacterium]